jgi:hypothetical protein
VFTNTQVCSVVLIVTRGDAYVVLLDAAHNLLAMMRVGCLEGGYDVLALRKNPPKGLKVYAGPSVDKKEDDLKKSSILARPAVADIALTPAAGIIGVA